MSKIPGVILRFMIFAYDSLRLLFILALLKVFLEAPSGPLGEFSGLPGGLEFPLIAFSAPNALFPLMSLFLLIRAAASRGFIPLYATGKVVCAAALGAWFLFALGKDLSYPRWPALLCVADLATAAGSALLKKPVPKGENQCVSYP
jgi:hypothetical protein